MAKDKRSGIDWAGRAGRTARELLVIAVILPVIVVWVSDSGWTVALLAALAPAALAAGLFFLSWRMTGKP